jgi:hypothetical protein
VGIVETLKLRKAIDYTLEKCNFHCRKYPDKGVCQDCNIEDKCNGSLLEWNCKGDLTFFKEGLSLAGVKEMDEYINWATEHGGHCDCEVIFNAMAYLHGKDKK